LNKILFFPTFFLFFINSCSFFKNIKNTQSLLEKQQCFFLNFEKNIENIILEILNNKDIFFSKKISLYINSLKNESNIFLENKTLINTIKYIIFKNKKKIKILDTKSINHTKRKLGLSQDNRTLNANEAILLSRDNHMTYYLDTCIIGKNESFFLKVQLILVKTGEIIFYKMQKIY